ncbi:MAG: alpha-mannosidase [Lachnospiraceae bacterium]|nr:alpha-mannosidase [Lachnospiraceae bacterium]
MYFLDKRVNVICEELKKLKVKQRFTIERWKYKEGNYIHPEEAQEDDTPWEVFDCKSMHWYGKDRHYWFRTLYRVPEELDGKRMWLHVRTQIDEWDDAKNPQFLLFVNGEAVQGIDMNHRDVFLCAEAKAGEELLLELQAYTGILHTEFNLIVEMQEIDERIEKLYYDLWVPLAAFSRMEEDDKNRRDIQEILNTTVNFLDLRTPYSDAFYRKLEEASDYIDQALYSDMGGYRDVIATCIGHTHIDVAWWWTVEQTREKVGRSFATVLKLMEEYPNYKFMSSQPQLYAFLKERYPELYEKIKERIREKRWEPEGGMWVEADCNLTSGESLVRQFMYGKRFFREEFGVDNRILWLPDVFGYSGALPQIMKKCGIDYFMTTKLAWNQFNKIPYDTMMWRGIDGTEVLTHLITTLGVNQPIKDYFTTYNGMLHPDAIMGGWMRYQNKDINNDILVSYGYGDGGGGPTREMLETSIRMEKGVKGIPAVRQEFARTYFDELKERVAGNKRLPVWEGEFYFEYHRGTLTSMARNKRSNRKAELGLMDLEFLSVLAAQTMRETGAAVQYPEKELEAMWKLVLLNQFHDILPGSAIHEVYEVTKEEYAKLAEQLSAMSAERRRAAAGKGNALTVFNTLGWERDDIVNLGTFEGNALVDEDGTVYPVQKTKGGSVAYIKNLPSKGYRSFMAAEPEKENRPFVLNGDYELETPFYVIKLDEQGMFTSIFDKENDREVIQAGERANLLRMYEDKPIYFDNWDIDIFYTEKFWDIDNVERMEWTEIGEVCAVLEIERKASNSTIFQKIIFYAESRRIDFVTDVDWKEHQTLLKVHFPVAVHTDEAAFDVQFGSLTRKTHQNTSWDVARFESCGQKWMDLSEGHYGVSLLNDCKYGHSVKDSNMALTLIKSGIEPNPTSDQEEHTFTYAIYPHAEGWRTAGTVQEAYELNQPLMAEKDTENGKSCSYASVAHSNVILETIKRAESGNGIVLRMYESENAYTKTKLTVNALFEKAYLCNLLEEIEGEAAVNGNVIDVVLKPYEVVTVLLQ